VLIIDPVLLSEQADNVVGEVWASGPSIASGYWRNPEASAKTFVRHAGQTWLRTGDLGFLRNGELFITGRLKDMLIVRGHNLYPQDIEQTVEREVEVVRKGRVAAFAVTVDGQEGIGIAAEISRSVQKILPPESLIKAIRQAVAEAYQEAPSVVVLLNPGALPKTSSGKLQRSACRNRLADGSFDSYAVFPSAATESAGKIESGSKLQSLIGRIWCEQLQVAQVGADDHFFLLGGNSIAATQVVARLREELGLELNLRLLFEAPTLGAFADVVARQQKDGGLAQGAITALSRQQPMPQSLAQNRLWITWQLDPHSSAYNIPGALRLRGELDEDALRASFQQLIERHESLRTRFLERDGVALQQIDPVGEFNLQVIDISDLPVAEREARSMQIREDEARTRFDLEQGPLLWVTLVRLDDEDHQLLVTLHHIVADGWSLNVLIDEFSRLYAAASQGQRALLAPLPTQYADYGSWQRQWLAQGEGERQLAYWKAQLGDEHPTLTLATDHPRSAQQLCSAARHTVRLEAPLSEAIRQTAQANESTP
ncbi:MAG: condensation domain-containing protein, partial [Pseudomonas sp.]